MAMRGAGWMVVAALLAGCLEGGATDATDGSTSQTIDASQAPKAAPKEGLGSIRVSVVTTEVEPVADAEVVLAKTEHAAYTDAAGAAVFNDLEPGTYTVVAAKPGYQAVQDKGRLAEVVAGEVADVRLTLDPISLIDANNTYEKTLHFKGFIACSFHMTLVGYTSYCGRGLQVQGQDLGRDPNDNSTHPWTIEGPHVQGVVLEAQWTPSNAALGAELEIRSSATFTCDAYHCSPGGAIHAAAGKSPLKASRVEGTKQNMTTAFGNDPAKFPRPVWSEARAYLCAGCTHDILINQRYDMFASAFYGKEPAADFTALPRS
ncbi:MAG: carboxypeptidase regulatory-like domain-containing protein [Euryarchaeota archaeon]|nr:carboxypeptidase regulatory-like domain-containing protein [Euryarchaeota archaeon]